MSAAPNKSPNKTNKPAEASKRVPLSPADLAATERLRALWKAKPKTLTQEFAAEQMGITQGAVSHYLKGRNKLGLVPVVQFAMLLGVPPQTIRSDLPGLELFTRNLSFSPASQPGSGSQTVKLTPETISLAKSLYRDYVQVNTGRDVGMLDNIDDQDFSFALSVAIEEMHGNAQDHAARNDVGLLKRMAAKRDANGNQRRTDQAASAAHGGPRQRKGR